MKAATLDRIQRLLLRYIELYEITYSELSRITGIDKGQIYKALHGNGYPSTVLKLVKHLFALDMEEKRVYTLGGNDRGAA